MATIQEIYEWAIKRCEEEDMSASAFIVRSLKKIKKFEENENGKETNFKQL